MRFGPILSHKKVEKSHKIGVANRLRGMSVAISGASTCSTSSIISRC